MSSDLISQMVGREVGGYRISRLIGEGGMGAVFLAEHKLFSKKVAIKVMLGAASPASEKERRRLLDEARTLCAVDHDGLVRFLDCGEFSDGIIYLQMEYVDGRALRDVLAAGRRLSDGESFSIALQVALALAAIHRCGVVHRDLTPNNIMLTCEPSGGVHTKILDFGIARLQSDGTMSTGLQGIGTPRYMAPEQCEGSTQPSAATDVYALGLILVELLTGESPYPCRREADRLAWMYAHIKTRPRRLQSLRKDLPEALDELIFRMLDKTPQQRPTADEVAQQLRLLSGLEEHAGSSLSHHHSGTESLRPGSVASRAVTWSSAPRHRFLPTRAGAVAALVTLASAALGVLGPQLHSGVTFLVSAPHPKPSLLVPQQPAAQTPGPQTPDVVSKQYDLTQLSARTPDGMVLIPARSFRMGSTPKQQADAMEWCKEESSQCELDYWTREKQSGLITVSPFYLDRTEVTNHEYLRFLQAHTSQFHIREQRGHRRIYDEKNRPLISLEDGIDVLAPSRLLLTELIVQKVDDSRPASSVSWFGAARFCRWKGHILPSEAQWEAAARGVSADGSPSLFPWGDSRPTCDGVGIAQEANPNVKVSKPLCFGQGSVGLRAVGTSWQDRTPHGVMDLAGNVMEWVRDEYVNPYPWEDGDRDPVHQSSPALEDTEVVRVRRGGSYSVEASSARATTRYQSNSTATKAGVGFRCAHEVSSASSRPTSNP